MVYNTDFLPELDQGLAQIKRVILEQLFVLGMEPSWCCIKQNLTENKRQLSCQKHDKFFIRGARLSTCGVYDRVHSIVYTHKHRVAQGEEANVYIQLELVNRIRQEKKILAGRPAEIVGVKGFICGKIITVLLKLCVVSFHYLLLFSENSYSSQHQLTIIAETQIMKARK